jgi:hypothetical protein
MPPRIYAIIVGLFLVATGCKSTGSNVPANVGRANASSPPVTTSPDAASSAVKAKVDVCGLLSSDDIKSVQGEAFKEAQRSDHRDGEFIVAQCYYALPTTSSSVVLNVTTASEGQTARNPRSFWQGIFGRKEETGGERERERGQEAKREGAESEEGVRPEKVAGLGEDAYWIPSTVGGALYVLKRDQFFRISVGGAGDQNARLKKSKTLAQQVLKRI